MSATYIEKEEANLDRKKSEVVEQELKKLYDKHKELTPEMVVAAAAAKSSPLHKFFEWNDSEAAKKYRLQQARQLILATKFVVVLEEERHKPPKVSKVAKTTERLVRKFLPTSKRGGDGFALRGDVLSDEEMRKAIIDKKKAVLRSWCESVVDIEEFTLLREHIEKALESV